jgi:uncharacterized membrane protein YidH (DUF202 family)
VRAITFLALLIGLLVAGLGAFGLLAPADFGATVLAIQKKSNIYFLAAARVVIGVVILLAATGSRFPFVLGTLAVLIILGGLITPFMAVPLRQSVEKWMSGGSSVPLQAWAIAALAIGAFIAYSTWPRRKA